MQGTVQSYVLYMADDKKKEPLKVKQYDTNSRWAKITLKAFDGEYWLIPFDAQIYINVLKTDGTLATATCTKVDEHTVLVPITEQMTAVPGTQLGELYFLGADGDIKSQTFPVAVYPMVMDQARIESSDDFQSLQEALRDVKVSTEAADSAAQYATEQGNAAGMAAQRAEDAADSIQAAVDAAAAAKACESNARDSELAAAQTQQEVTDYVEAQKAAFVGYSKRESDSKYANAITAMAEGEGGVTVEDAWTAPVLDMEVAGKSEQVITTGAQLIDVSRLETISAGGATVTNNRDGSFAVSGSGTLTSNFAKSYVLTHDESVRLFPAGVYTMTRSPAYPYFYVQAIRSGINSTSMNSTGSANLTITEEIVTDPTYAIQVGFYGLSGRTIVPGIIKPIVNAGDTALPYEPYTGGAPSPSPDYPQDIISTGTVSTGAQMLDSDSIVQGMIDGNTGIESTSSTFARSDYISVEPGGYVLSGHGLEPYINYAMCYNQEKVLQSALYIALTNGKFTVSEGIAYIRFRFISKDGPYGTVTPAEIIASKPMLNAGNTALPWEPYTGGKPAPSVEYPQTLNIYSFMGNRNLLKKSGNPITTNSYMMKQYNFGDIKPLDGEKYTIQIKGILGNGKSGISIFNSGGYLFETSLYPENRDSNGIYKKSFTWKSKSDAYIADDTFIYVYAVPGSVEVESTIEWIKLEKGELATPWVPAPEDITSENAEQYSDLIRTASITLTEPLRGIGDYRDRIMCRDGVWGIERWIGAVDNAQWRMTNIVTGTSGHRFVVSAPEMQNKQNCNVLCTKYKRRSASSFTVQGDYVSTDERGAIHVRTFNPDFETIEAFKEFMADAVTLYPLATPTWEPFPDATQQALNALTTYAGTTHLTITTGGAIPSVTLDYVKDTHKALEQCQEAAREYTDNQIAAIVAALPTATQAAIVDNQTTRLLQEV